MKLSAILIGAMAIGLASCGGTTPPPGQTANPTLTAAGPAPDGSNASVTDRTPKKAPRSEGDVPPAGARYNIFCDVFNGPDHVVRSSHFRDELVTLTKMSGWHIIHSEDESTLYFGYYRTFDDPKNDPAETARAKADLAKLHEMRNAQTQDRLFPNCVFLAISSPDPIAPPEWNLVNAPANAYWSLQIAAYRDMPQRKQAAVDTVRDMRARGLPGYYYHGESISSVCIGAWPADAVKRQESSEGRTATYDPDVVPVIVGVPLPPNFKPPAYTSDGKRLEVQAPKIEIVDPTMLKAMQDYPSHAINGYDYVKKGKNGEDIKAPSFLVVIPNRDPNGGPVAGKDGRIHDDTATINGANQAAGAIIDTPAPFKGTTPKEPGRGNLRSLDNP